MPSAGEAAADRITPPSKLSASARRAGTTRRTIAEMPADRVDAPELLPNFGYVAKAADATFAYA